MSPARGKSISLSVYLKQEDTESKAECFVALCHHSWFDSSKLKAPDIYRRLEMPVINVLLYNSVKDWRMEIGDPGALSIPM
jgi:hypothetical protein